MFARLILCPHEKDAQSHPDDISSERGIMSDWFILARQKLGSITSRCSGKEPALLPELTAGLMDLALLVLTNEISACLNRAGCINYLSRSSKEVV